MSTISYTFWMPCDLKYTSIEKTVTLAVKHLQIIYWYIAAQRH